MIVIASAAPAWSHAVLVSSTPATSSVVSQSPPQLSLTFNEPVEISLGAIRLFDCGGKRITVGAPQHGASSRVVNASLPKLAPGTYAVSWHVISADSHPVGSTFFFTVGEGSGNGAQCKATTTVKSSKTVGVLFGVDRFLLFTGLALFIGGAVFLVVIARGTSAARRTRTVMWTGWWLTLVTTVVGIALQGPYGEGSGIGDAVNSTIFRDILHTRYGHIAELRLVFLVAALPFLLSERRLSERKPLPVAWIGGATVVGLLLAATPGLAGHAATGDNTVFAVPLDTLHVAAMCVWFGGLAALLVSAVGGGFSGGLRRALVRFSALATGCVITLVLTGLFASWRQVGFKVDGYLHTSYGNMLLVKVGIVVVLVALAGVSRAVVQRRRSAPLDAPDSAIAAIDQRTVGQLRRSVGGEVLLGIAVLVATALLVNAQPARSALTPRLFSKTVPAGSGQQAMLVNVIVDPAKNGVNIVHVYTQNPNGTDLSVRTMTGDFYLGSTRVPANLTKAGPNHYLNNAVLLTSPGKWQFALHIGRVFDGEIRDTAAVVDVPIR